MISMAVLSYIAVFACLEVAAAQLQLIAPTQMQRIGRYEMAPCPKVLKVGVGSPNAQQQCMNFDMPGVEIRVGFQLSAPSVVQVKLAQRHSPVPPGSGNTRNSGFESNAFVIFVDGVRVGAGGYNATFTTNKTQADAVPYLYGIGTLSAGHHTVRMLKATEADWNGGSPAPNWVTLYGLQVQGGAVTVSTSSALPSRKIEFLGDSITAGFCNECLDDNPLKATDHNQAYGATWDFQIGELCNAQVHTAAWSGLGMIRNCCGGNTTMPSIFTRTLATKNVDNTWRWSSWVPDALVINLGTNDGAAALKPEYVTEYVAVVMAASQHYGAQLHVFLACGPMSTTYCDPVQKVISTVRAHGVKAYFLDQRGFLDGKFGKGCCGHPSIAVDTAMASAGAAFIKKTLGW